MDKWVDQDTQNIQGKATHQHSAALFSPYIYTAVNMGGQAVVSAYD